MAGVDGIVEAGVLHAAFALGEDFQLALGAVDKLLVGAMCPLQRDLAILLSMRDQEGHADLLDHAIQMDVFGDTHEVVDILCAPDPAHVLPVMRYRKIALFFQAAFLYIAPVMVSAPGHTAGEAWLHGHHARAVVAAQRDAFATDTRRVHVIACFQPIYYAAAPVLGVVACCKTMQA